MEIHDFSDGVDNKIYLLRHGKALHNKPDEVATFGGGQIDNELTKTGELETAKFAEDLFRESGGIDGIFCSGMKRSRQTAEILSRRLEELNGDKVKIVVLNDLEEINVGDFTGRTEAESREIDHIAAEAFYDGKITDLNFPNGEDYEKLKKRVGSVTEQLKRVACQKPAGNFAVVGHGMFNRVILHELFYDKTDLWRQRKYPHDRVIVFNTDKLK